eukprot:COSAG01_NODE_6664_length_3557_cov_2.259977_4_plen_158_part_00
MESLLERKNLEKAVLERRLSSKPSPELASYIEGFKIGQVSEEISRAGLGGGMSGSSQSQLPVFSQFLHDSAAVASGHQQQLSVPSSPDQAAAAAGGARARRLRQQGQQPAPSVGGRSAEAAASVTLVSVSPSLSSELAVTGRELSTSKMAFLNAAPT